MIQIRAWRCLPRVKGLARSYDASARTFAHYQRLQQRTISENHTSATFRHHAHGQRHIQTGIALEDVDMPLSLDESARHEESDLTEPEFDRTLDKEAKFLTVAEQEARFQITENGKFRSNIHKSCLACHMPHCLARCPHIFEDTPRYSEIRNEQTLKFNQRMNSSPEFREAVAYLRKRFTSRDANGNLVPVPRSETQDAPPLARGWLSNFDRGVLFHRSGTGGDTSTLFKTRYTLPQYTYFPGYYATTDDDGRPFLILYTNSGHMDGTMPYEIDMIRTFVAKYNKGEKAFVQDKSPDMDTRPIGVVMVTKRWHLSKASARLGHPCTTVGIASEYTWHHGYARWGIHINAHRGVVENGYSGWTSGRVTEFGASTTIDWNADTAGSFKDGAPAYIAGFGNALVRDVREPVEKLMGIEESTQNWYRILFWRRILLHRAATFYGTSSPQYRLVYAYAQGKYGDVEVADRDVPVLDALPRWKHIQSRISMAGKPYEEETIMRSIFH